MKQKTTSHGLLPILSQHFGSGKTTLVKEFRKDLKERGETERYQLRPNEESIFQHLISAVLVNIPLNCATVSNKSFEDELNLPDGAFSVLFLRRLQDSLRLSVKSLNKTEDDNAKLLRKTCRIINCVYLKDKKELVDEEINIAENLLKSSTWNMFLSLYSHYKLFPLLILVDEVSFLEYHYKQEYKPFIKLWEGIMKPMMGIHSNCDRIFFVVCGTSSNLTKLGRGLLRQGSKLLSPTPALHITLEMLKVEHIKDLFEKTLASATITIKQFLLHFCKIADNFEYFCKVVHIYTTRLIVYVVNSLLQYVHDKNIPSIDFSSRSNIDKTFADFEHRSELKDVIIAREISPFCDESNDSKLSHLKTIFTMGILGIPIPISDKFITEIDLIHDLNVAVEFEKVKIGKNDDTELIKMLIPRFTLVKAVKEGNFDNISILSSFPQRYYGYVEKGDLLERLFLDTILIRLLVTIKVSNTKKWSNVHNIFSYSQFIKDRDVILDVNSPVFHIPKIVSAKNKNTPRALSLSKRHYWHFHMNYSHWDTLYQLTKTSIGHPAPMSKSPDFIIPIPTDTVISIACKNYHSRSKFTLKMLQDEIDKASLIKKKNALFVFTTQLCKSLEISIRNNIIRLTEGKWTFGDTLKRSKLERLPNLSERAEGTRYSKNTINVYPNMEIIILGKEILQTFFLHGDTQLLEEMVNAKTFPKFSSMEDWINGLLQ